MIIVAIEKQKFSYNLAIKKISSENVINLPYKHDCCSHTSKKNSYNLIITPIFITVIT